MNMLLEVKNLPFQKSYIFDFRPRSSLHIPDARSKLQSREIDGQQMRREVFSWSISQQWIRHLAIFNESYFCKGLDIKIFLYLVTNFSRKSPACPQCPPFSFLHPNEGFYSHTRGPLMGSMPTPYSPSRVLICLKKISTNLNSLHLFIILRIFSDPRS